jgi:dienelactone hydrolase
MTWDQQGAVVRAVLLWVAFGLAFGASAALAQSKPGPGPQGSEEGELRRQLWLIPSPEPGVLMRATVLRPRGAGPFPLAVVNHGSTQSAQRRAAMPLPSYEELSRWLVERGYVVVLPQRPGHGATGGAYLENQGGCATADYRKAGLGTAASIAAAVSYMTKQRFVRPTGAVIAGQSAGGWGAIAFASLAPRGVRAVISFSGGRGGRSYDKPNNNCAPDRLVGAARRFGATARIPTLWLYSANDSYFAPSLSKRMADEFRAAGGRAEYHLLPAYGAEGHRFVEAPESMIAWAPILRDFLTRVGKK